MSTGSFNSELISLISSPESSMLQKGSCYKARRICKKGNIKTQMAGVSPRLLDLPSTSESSAGG